MAAQKYLAAASHLGDRVVIYNVTDPSNVSLVGDTGATFPDLNDLSVCRKVGNAIVTSSVVNHHVSLIDISDLENPSVEDTLTASGQFENARWAEPHPNGTHMLMTFRDGDRVSCFNPNLTTGEITQASFLDDADAGVDMDGPQQIVISESGQFAYVSTIDDDDIAVIDISDPDNISLTASVLVTGVGNIVGITRIGDVLFVNDSTAGLADLFALDASDEDAPEGDTKLGTLTDEDAASVQLLLPSKDGNYVYGISFTTPEVVVFDVSDVENMSVAGKLAINSFARGGFTIDSDGILYASDPDNDRIYIIDAVTDPENPASLGTIVDATRLNAVHGLDVWTVGDAADFGGLPRRIRMGLGLGL